MNTDNNTPPPVLDSRRQFFARGFTTLGGAVLLGAALDAVEADAAPPRRPTPIGGFASTTLGNHLVYASIPDPKHPGQMKDISANVPGVAHERGTARGGLGVTVLAGHRSSFRRPFRYIERLRVGEIVRYDNTADNTQTEYRVVEIKFPLDPYADYDQVCGNDVRYGSDRRLNLYACCRANGRPTSTKYRIAAFCVAV